MAKDATSILRISSSIAAIAVFHVVAAVAGATHHGTIFRHLVIVTHQQVIAHHGAIHKVIVADHHLLHHGSRAIQLFRIYHYVHAWHHQSTTTSATTHRYASATTPKSASI